MTLIGFPFTTTRLDCINRILIANSTAVIAMNCIIDPHGCRIIPVGIISMADGRAGVFGLVVLADSYAHVVGHTVFPDGHTVFLGIGLMTDCHSRPAFSSHIAAQSHGIGRIDEPGHHIIPVHKGPVRSIVPLPAVGDVSLFIQPKTGIRLVACQFSISIHVVAADRIQDLGLVANGRGMVPFRHIVHAYCRSPTDIIRLTGPILSVIGSHIVVDFHCLAVVFIRAVITPFRIFGPDVILVIHVLAGSQLIDFHLFVIIGIGIGIVHLHCDPFRIQLLIGIGSIPADGLLGFRGMSEFAHAVPGPHDHVFRFAVHPGIAGFRVLLDRNDLIVFTHDQIALGIVSGISIRPLSGCIILVFNIHRLIGRRIPTIRGCRCLSPVRGSKERCRQDKGRQDGRFAGTSAAAAAYMAIVMALGQFRHDNVTISCFTPNNFKDFIHRASPFAECIS